ncbi:MAG: efflux RND transporter permease subunit [Proteobacteria bacterium]|nr:efflux RND transporter permease subunit [Pseudomonadota bacterium]MDA1021844.1 efflux RND transporter permease subunit [Pseudomonadota bacterium]
MDLIRVSIERPVAVIAAVLMIVMFGVLALTKIPIQLTPDVRKPIISLETVWPGAAPAEIEREITNRQEEELKGIKGLDQILSESQDGRSLITLEFAVGTNMAEALLLVSNRLDRVSGYPDEASEPSIRSASSDDNPITWVVLIRTPGNDKPIHSFGDFTEDVIQDRLERVNGVARVNVYGSALDEMEVVVDSDAMARYGLTVSKVASILRGANASISAGDVDEGKRRYVVRVEGEFSKLDDVRGVVLRSETDPATGAVARVTVGDIAEVSFVSKEATASIRFNGQPAIAINAVRETGANVIEVMRGIRAAIAELNENALPEAKLRLQQVYDETTYINSSIDLVQQNIFIGGSLAALMLLLFLRSWSATLVVSLAIPVSIIGAFVAMAAMGRSLNVISLAGIAFAVGMVVDAAIVVLENIYRHREMGASRTEAAYRGAKEVWPAVFVSALTTVMVFLPILVMELEVGQLFRDIAVALSVSVLLSLLVAITVIPALSNRLLEDPDAKTKPKNIPLFNTIASITRLPLALLDRLAGSFVEFTLAFTRRVAKSRSLAITVVGALCGAGVLVTVLLLPKLEYLPDGNRNLIFGVIVPPPGYNLETTTEIAGQFEDKVMPMLAEVNGSESKPGDPPKIQRFFFVAARGRTFLGAAAEDPDRVRELIPILKKAVYSEPGTFGLISQRSLFGRGIGGSRSIEMNISGPDLEEVLDVSLSAVQLIDKAMPRSQGTQIQPKPGLELGAPEVRIFPNRVKLADNGVTARELGDTLDAFNDGIRVAEITVGSKRIDLMLRGKHQNIKQTQEINQLPVVTSSGTIVPVSSLADVQVTSGPTQIRHLERQRTVTLEIRPPEGVPLESALDVLHEKVITPLRDAGMPNGMHIRLTGTADKLSQTWDAMVVNLLISVIIVYLVMAVLFESFVYPLIIMLSVPLATGGGVIGLALVNLFTFQPLDMLTLLGFVILIGIVVNNAILLVHQTLLHIHEEGMAVEDAILEATRNRIRPIFMSTLTSVFGMAPLVFFPGAGSELYRGLGSVVLGGLSLSAVLTLAIVPPLLTMVAGTLEKGATRRGSQATKQAKPAE